MNCHECARAVPLYSCLHQPERGFDTRTTGSKGSRSRVRGRAA